MRATKVKGSGGDRGSSDETVGRDSEQEKDGAADSWPLAGIRIGARECVRDAPPFILHSPSRSPLLPLPLLLPLHPGETR